MSGGAKRTPWRMGWVILVPALWLCVFFLVPFLIVLKISVSQTVIAQPPYTPVLDLAQGLQGVKDFVAGLSFESFKMLGSDAIYIKSYLRSLTIAAFSISPFVYAVSADSKLQTFADLLAADVVKEFSSYVDVKLATYRQRLDRIVRELARVNNAVVQTSMEENELRKNSGDPYLRRISGNYPLPGTEAFYHTSVIDVPGFDAREDYPWANGAPNGPKLFKVVHDNVAKLYGIG